MSKYLHFASFSIFLIAFVSIFFPTWSSLFARWGKMDESYSHGYLVLIISLYFIYQQIRFMDVGKVKENYLFVPLLLLCSLLWSLSYHAYIEVFQQILLPIMLVLFFVLVLGFKAGKKFLFPVLILLFAIPFWDYFVTYLQNITVYVNSIWLDIVGIPAYIEGVRVTIPAGVFEVAGGCSGLRYLVTALTLASLYIYLNYSRWSTGLTLIITAIFFALLANWLRVFIIIVIGHETDMQSSLIKEHDTFGWYLFAATLVPFFYLAHRYTIWFDDGIPEKSLQREQWPEYKLMPYVIVSLATFSLPLLISVPANKIHIENTFPTFVGELDTKSKQMIFPIFKGADIIQDEIFNSDGEPLQVSIRRYAQQRQGKELVFYSNRVYSNRWQKIQHSIHNGFSILQLENLDNNQKVLLASQYHIGGYPVSHKLYAKFLELFKPLMSSQWSSVIIFATPCQNSCQTAQDRIDGFVLVNKEILEQL